jgi:hypothetical protein
LTAGSYVSLSETRSSLDVRTSYKGAGPLADFPQDLKFYRRFAALAPYPRCRGYRGWYPVAKSKKSGSSTKLGWGVPTLSDRRFRRGKACSHGVEDISRSARPRDKFPELSRSRPLPPDASTRCARAHHRREENPHRKHIPRAGRAWAATRFCSG